MSDTVIENIKKNRIYFIGWLWDSILGITGGIIFYPDICEFREYAADTLFRILIRALREGKLDADETLAAIVRNFGNKMTGNDTSLERAYTYLDENTPMTETKLLSMYFALTAKDTDLYLTTQTLSTGTQTTVFGVQSLMDKSATLRHYSFFVHTWNNMKQNNTIIVLLGQRVNATAMTREFLVYNFTGDSQIAWVDTQRFSKKAASCYKFYKSIFPREYNSSDPVLLSFSPLQSFEGVTDNLLLQSAETLKNEKKRKLRLTDFTLELNREFCLFEPCTSLMNTDLFSTHEKKVGTFYGTSVTWQLMKGLFTGREYMLPNNEKPIGGKYICMQAPKNTISLNANNYELSFSLIGVMYWNNVPVLMLLYPYEFVRDYYSEDGIDMDIGHALSITQFIEKYREVVMGYSGKRRYTPSIFKGEAGRLVLCEVNSTGLFDDMYSFPFKKLSTDGEASNAFIESLMGRWESQISNIFAPVCRAQTFAYGFEDEEFGREYYAKFSLKQR